MKKRGKIIQFPGQIIRPSQGYPQAYPQRWPPTPERKLHCALVKLIRLAIKPKWVFWHTPNGEYRTEATGALLKAMGTRAGVSDLVFVGPPFGRTFVLELKRRGEKPSDEQREFIREIVEAGGTANWTDSFKGAVKILRRWDAIREVDT